MKELSENYCMRVVFHLINNCYDYDADDCAEEKEKKHIDTVIFLKNEIKNSEYSKFLVNEKNQDLKQN